MTVKSYVHYSRWPQTEWHWPNFSPREMASKREGALSLDTDAMDKLQALRDQLGKPMLITSAYRSPAHNKAVGGAKNSYHMRGMAFDVRMENQDPVEFEMAARAVGFKGFGHYVKNGFMHIDTRPTTITFKGNVSDWPRGATRLAVETPRVPESIREDKQAGAAIGAGGAGAIAVAIDAIPAASGILGNLAPAAQLIAVGAAALFLGYLIWKKIK